MSPIGTKRTSGNVRPMSASRGIVSKVENRTTQKISRKLIFWTSLLLRRYSAPLRRSVVDFGRIDMVPHDAARKTHQQL